MVITGFSGAGKSTAMNVFEDAGYFCVDNLPPGMIGSLIELFVHEGSKVERAAVVSDVRGGEYFEELAAVLDDLDRMRAAPPRAVPRRRGRDAAQPLQGDAPAPPARAGRLDRRRHRGRARPARRPQGARRRRHRHDRAERRDAARARSSRPSSASSRRAGSRSPSPASASSTARRATPTSSSTCASCPTRTTSPTCATLTGLDPRVVEFIDRDGKLAEFYALLEPLLDYLLGQYVAEGKSYLLVAIGCTGGRHRSVAIAEHLAARYGGRADALVAVTHRDVGEGADAAVIDHVGFEVADLARSAAFYDAVFHALGGRRLHDGEHAIAYGMFEPALWIVTRGRAPAPGYGHVALKARGRAAVAAAHAAALAHGGRDDGAPGPAARSTGRSTTPPTCATPTACGSSSSAARADWRPRRRGR